MDVEQARLRTYRGLIDNCIEKGIENIKKSCDNGFFETQFETIRHDDYSIPIEVKNEIKDRLKKMGYRIGSSVYPNLINVFWNIQIDEI